MLRGPDALAALDWLDRHRDDERAALARLDMTDSPGLVELTAAAWPYWDYRCLLAEGRSWLEKARARREPEEEAGGAPDEGAGSAHDEEVGSAHDEARLAVLAGIAKMALTDDDAPAATAACWEGLALAAASGIRQARAPFLSIQFIPRKTTWSERAT